MIDNRENNHWSVYIHIVPKELSGYEFDKYYIGITGQKDINKRWNYGNGYRYQFFHRAIKKYGWNNIQHEIIGQNLTVDEAKQMEIALIHYLKSNYQKYGYNLTKGGDYVTESLHNNRMNPIGKKYGRYTVIRERENNKSYNCRLVDCICECGTISYNVNLNSLVLGKSKSCGCLAKEICSTVHKKYNTYDLSDEYGIGFTSKGEKFYFDLEDYDKIKNYCWSYDSKIHKLRTEYLEYGKRIYLDFICCIFGFGKQSKKKVKVEFLDNNNFNYVKSNLKLYIPNGLTYDQYVSFLMMNNEYIVWDTQRKKWVLQMRINNSSITKRFDILQDAINLRDKILSG